MDEQCCVDGCFRVKEELYYFKLPVSRALRKRWVEAINSTAKLTDDATVCSRHFREEQYMFVRGKRRLKPKVVPCLFERKETQDNGKDTESDATNEQKPADTKLDTEKESAGKDKEQADRGTDSINTETKGTDKEIIDKDKERIEGNKSSSEDEKSPGSVKKADIEFSPNKDIEDILTNYHIKQTRPLAEISAEREPERGEVNHGGGGEMESEPKYVEVSVGSRNQDQTTNQDCLMLLENVQVEIDPSMFPLDHDRDQDDQNIEHVDLDQDSSSDCIDLGEKKEEPISLLSSSDEDEVMIQEPKIDTITVSDATDEDDIPLLKLVRRNRRTRKCEKRAAINRILVSRPEYADAADHAPPVGKRTHMVHMCELCNYHTHSWLLMHRHREKHTRESKNARRRNREKKYQCPLCSYRAKHNMSLVYHMGTHARPRLACDGCGFGPGHAPDPKRCPDDWTRPVLDPN